MNENEHQDLKDAIVDLAHQIQRMADKQDEMLDDVKKIKEATGEDATDLDNKNSLIDIDTSVSLKLFIKNIDNYIINKLKETDKKVTYDDSSDVKPSGGMLTSGFTPYILYDENKFMCDVGTFTDLTNQSKETWVRWGWFEDNVLSKFLSVTSDRIITKFRSIERIQKAGKDSVGSLDLNTPENMYYSDKDTQSFLEGSSYMDAYNANKFADGDY